ncbi:MAG: hypothetical protein WD801_05970 [Gemmatimonadaceae bacterium]
MSCRAIVVLTLGWLGTASAFAQGNAQSASALSARLSPATRAQLERLVDSARASGLPAEPLVARAAEGVLKGADEARIVGAVRSLARELAAARAVLPAGASAATLAAGAGALRAGVSRETLRRLSVASIGAAEGDLALALVTVADMAANQVPPTRAGEAVEQLLQRRAPASEIMAFRETVARDILAGVSPVDALDARSRTILGRPAAGATIPPIP